MTRSAEKLHGEVDRPATRADRIWLAIAAIATAAPVVAAVASFFL